MHGRPSPAQPVRSPLLPGAGSFPGLQLKQALSVGPNSALSKDPCVSLKRGIDRALVRAAQPMAGWLGLARPRNFPKPSYFLFLGPAPSGPPGHRAQSRYTALPVPWLPARRDGVGGGCHFIWSSGHTANAPWRPLDEDASLETRSILPSPHLCPHCPFDGSFWGASLHGSPQEARAHTGWGLRPS